MANPVPVTTASAETANWRTYIDALTTTPIHAMLIPRADVQCAMTVAATGGIRVYGALKVANDPTSFHLYVVGVDSSGNDIVTVGGNSAVYDNTSPCPPICSNTNALNS